MFDFHDYLLKFAGFNSNVNLDKLYDAYGPRIAFLYESQHLEKSLRDYVNFYGKEDKIVAIEQAQLAEHPWLAVKTEDLWELVHEGRTIATIKIDDSNKTRTDIYMMLQLHAKIPRLSNEKQKIKDSLVTRLIELKKDFEIQKADAFHHSIIDQLAKICLTETVTIANFIKIYQIYKSAGLNNEKLDSLFEYSADNLFAIKKLSDYALPEVIQNLFLKIIHKLEKESTGTDLAEDTRRFNHFLQLKDLKTLDACKKWLLDAPVSLTGDYSALVESMGGGTKCWTAVKAANENGSLQRACDFVRSAAAPKLPEGLGKNVLEVCGISEKIDRQIFNELYNPYHLQIAYVSPNIANHARLKQTIENHKQNHGKFLIISEDDIKKLYPGTWIVIKEGSQWLLRKISKQNPMEFSDEEKLDQPLLDKSDGEIAAGLVIISKKLNDKYAKDKKTLSEKVIDPLWGLAPANDVSPKAEAKIFYEIIIYKLGELCLQLKFKEDGSLEGSESLKNNWHALYQAYKLYPSKEKNEGLEEIFLQLGGLLKISSTEHKVLMPAVQQTYEKIIGKLIKRPGDKATDIDTQQIGHFLDLQNVTEATFDGWKRNDNARSKSDKFQAFSNYSDTYYGCVIGIKNFSDVEKSKTGETLTKAFEIVKKRLPDNSNTNSNDNNSQLYRKK